MNKALDKVQKLMRVRSEYLSLLSSLHSCQNMYADITSSSKEVIDIQAAAARDKPIGSDAEADQHQLDPPSDVVAQSTQSLSRKIKIF